MARREIDEQLLFDEALNEFTRYSFEESSINRIIKNAKITKGSFYYRFSNKYELYIYLLREGNKKKWQFINSDSQNGAESAIDIFELFKVQAESGVRFALAQPRYYKLSKMFSKEKGSPLYHQALEALGIPEESGLSMLITDSYKSGSFNNEYSLEFIEKVITSLFSSFDEILFRDEEFDLDKAMIFLNEFINFLKHGLKA